MANAWDDDPEWSSALREEWKRCEDETFSAAGPCPDADTSAVREEQPPEGGAEAVRDRILSCGDKASKERYNTAAGAKVALRRAAIAWVQSPSVLELCCGMGHMWSWCYRDLPYHGVDKAKVFSPRLCDVAPAEDWIEEHDLGSYNVIDVDTFGSPWQIVSRVLHRTRTAPMALIATCGMRQAYSRGTRPDHLALCFGADRALSLAGSGPWYDEYLSMVISFVDGLADATGRHVAKRLHADNGRSGHDTNYWAFLLEAK